MCGCVVKLVNRIVLSSVASSKVTMDRRHHHHHRSRRRDHDPVPRRLLPFFVSSLLVMMMMMTMPHSVDGSSASHRNYNVYNYDQTSSQFTPDGRLLQVEYASNAALFSPPVVVVECLTTAPTEEGHDDASSSSSFLLLLTIPRQRERTPPTQQRIVILDRIGDDDGIDGNDGRSNPGCCVAMAGVLSDSLALLRAGLRRVQDDRHLYRQASPSATKLASIFADECHGRAFLGGIRPFGSTLVVCGYVDDFDDDVDGRGHRQSAAAYVFQTDPSGGIRHHPSSLWESRPSGRSGGGSDRRSCSSRSTVRCVVGGSSTQQQTLSKKIQEALDRLDGRSSSIPPTATKQRRPQPQPQHPSPADITLSDRIAAIANVLINEDEQSNPKTRDKDSPATTTSTTEDDDDDDLDIPLEVVVLSPQFGCHRLDTEQLRVVRTRIKEMQ